MFTPKEKEVIYLIGLGLNNESIAFAMNISYKALDSHIHRIYEKIKDYKLINIDTINIRVWVALKATKLYYMEL